MLQEKNLWALGLETSVAIGKDPPAFLLHIVADLYPVGTRCFHMIDQEFLSLDTPWSVLVHDLFAEILDIFAAITFSSKRMVFI